ncbi:hypothetical protein LCGC14_1973580, partial [marine sediment metagenome]
LQGRYNLLALREVLPALRRVQVFDTRGDALAKFAADMGSKTSLEIVPAGSAEEVFDGADIAVTATGWLDEPIFKADWIAPGTLALPIHARGWEPKALREVDKFIVDDWQQFSHSLAGFYGPMPEPYAQLGQVVVGDRPGRESPTERIIDFNYGMAIHDVAMATEILGRARQQGLGTTLPHTDGVMPYSQ